jgi:hypothetical protein
MTGSLHSRCFHIPIDALGVLGAIALSDLRSLKKATRRSSVTQLSRLLRTARLLPTDAKIISVTQGADKNGVAILLVEIDNVDHNEFVIFMQGLEKLSPDYFS